MKLQWRRQNSNQNKYTSSYLRKVITSNFFYNKSKKLFPHSSFGFGGKILPSHWIKELFKCNLIRNPKVILFCITKRNNLLYRPVLLIKRNAEHAFACTQSFAVLFWKNFANSKINFERKYFKHKLLLTRWQFSCCYCCVGKNNLCGYHQINSTLKWNFPA